MMRSPCKGQWYLDMLGKRTTVCMAFVSDKGSLPRDLGFFMRDDHHHEGNHECWLRVGLFVVASLMISLDLMLW